MNGDLKEAHDAAIKVGARAQVITRHHVHEGMVGDVQAIGPNGELKMVSRSDTRFEAMPNDVRVVRPS